MQHTEMMQKVQALLAMPNTMNAGMPSNRLQVPVRCLGPQGQFMYDTFCAKLADFHRIECHAGQDWEMVSTLIWKITFLR
jgi:hypothetical protein